MFARRERQLPALLTRRGRKLPALLRERQPPALCIAQ